MQVLPLVGLVVDPLVPTKEPQEPTTMTPAASIYQRRVQVLDRAGQTNVTEACRTFGISRTTYYGLVSPACSAIVQQFLRGRSESSPPTNALACRLGSTLANRPATRPTTWSNSSRQRAGSTTTLWPAATV